jgi:hypothetical protein
MMADSRHALIAKRFLPVNRRPQLAVNRHWSNPRLQEPEKIIAAVLHRPTTRDLTRIILAYGIERVVATREKIEPELPVYRKAYLARIWTPVVEGLSDAALRCAS